MQPCCNDCYRICKPYNDCPSLILVDVPSGYTGGEWIGYGNPYIILGITKPGVNAKITQQLEVIDGTVEIDFEGLPDGFFNAWGGDYKLEFTDPDTRLSVPFIAADGKQYDCFTFNFVQVVAGNTNEIVINPYV
jgi:hypothetical protein